MFVLELPPCTFEFRREGPPVQLCCGKVVFLGDVLGPKEAKPVELHLQGAAVFVGVSLNVDVEWALCLMEELLGEFPPHAGVDRAGTVDQLQGEVGYAAAVLADRGVRGEEAGAQPGARLQITRPELLFIQRRSLLALPLDGPCRQSRDDAALEDQDQYHERYRYHHRARRLCPVICGVDRGEVRDHHRDRVVGGVEDERVGEKELVPRLDERQDRRREHPWRRERHDYLAERLYRSCPVYLCGLFKVGGQFPEEGDQNPDRQRQREDHIRDDHGPVGVYDPGGRELDEQRSYDRHRREEADREDQRHYRAL